MIKEAAIALYLVVLRALFRIFKMGPLQNKTVMLTSFGDNMQYIIDEVKKQPSSKIFILKEPRCSKEFNNINSKNIIEFTPRKILSLIKGMYHLATSKYVFIDNYHVVLAACDFKQDVKCTQLWHANGAVKYFGYRDKTILNRPDSAHKRFKEVYNRFHHIVVSSDEMAYIFGEAFGADNKRMIKTGLPRTDFYYDKQAMESARQNIRATLPQIDGKKVLLYAPTFRDHQFEVQNVHLDIDLMQRHLGTDYHLLLKLHPAVELTSFKSNEFVTNVSSGYDINALLTIADILITDYSSIPFEFSILNKPMIFYAYDLEEYEAARGIWVNYESYMPGPLANNTEGIINAVQENNFDLIKIASFNNQWNKYADGESTTRLVNYIYKE